MKTEIRRGDALGVLRTMQDESVQCVVTSPPYWGLRDYGIEGQLGLERTPEEYVTHLVEVFREVWRVLRDDGTLWLNLGDSFSSQGGPQVAQTRNPNRIGGSDSQNGGKSRVSANFLDCFQRLIERKPLVIGNAATITITTKRSDVALHDNGFPYRKLFSLLGIERVTIKQGDNNFCQVLHTLAAPSYCWVDAPVRFASVNGSDLEIVIDAGHYVGVIVSEHDGNSKAVLEIARVVGLTCEDGDSPFAVKDTTKPITETIRDGQTIGDAVTFDAPLKRFPDVYFVNEAVALGDRLSPPAGFDGDFIVTKASPEQLHFTLGGCGVDLRAINVTHLYSPNEFGSLVRYVELYDKAKRKANASQAKQELGIPDMVKRALMEDGWICRSTIIWSKPNPMPESVTDRPTKSHEYIFLMSKRPRYYYDADAIREPLTESSIKRDQSPRGRRQNGGGSAISMQGIEYTTELGDMKCNENGRNKRTVWTINTAPYKGAHFATFPPKLVEPMILAGCPVGGTVLDPFCGSGTVGAVCVTHNRSFVGIELNPAYIALAEERITKAHESHPSHLRSLGRSIPEIAKQLKMSVPQVVAIIHNSIASEDAIA